MVRWTFLVMLFACVGDPGILVSVSSEVSEEDDTTLFWRVTDDAGDEVFKVCGLWSDESLHRDRPFLTLVPEAADAGYGVEVLAVSGDRARAAYAQGGYDSGTQQQVHLDLDGSECDVGGECFVSCYEPVSVDSDAASGVRATCGVGAPRRYCDGVAVRDAAGEGTTLFCDDFEPGALRGELVPRNPEPPNSLTLTRFECTGAAPVAYSGLGALRTEFARPDDGRNGGALLERNFAEQPSGILRIRLRLLIVEAGESWEIAQIRTEPGVVHIVVIGDEIEIRGLGDSVRFRVVVPADVWTCLEWEIPLDTQPSDSTLWVDGEAQTLQVDAFRPGDYLGVAAGFNSLNNGPRGNVIMDELVVRMNGDPIGCD